MLRPFVAQVLVVMQPEEDTCRPVQTRLVDVGGLGPARRAIGRDQARLARTPDRHGDGDAHGDHAAGGRNGATDVENLRSIGAEEEPPVEQPPGVIDRRAEAVEPGRAQAYLIAQGGGCPLCGGPHAGDHDAEYGGDLPEQHVRPLHFPAPDLSCERSKNAGCVVEIQCRVSAGQRPLSGQN
ncbi:hypothetical protein D9M68_400650 [compost metagenome]